MQIHLLKPLLFIFGIIVPVWTIYRWLISRKNIGGKGINLQYELVLAIFITYICIGLELTIVPASISGFNNPKEPALNIIPVIHTYKQFISTLTETDKTDTDFALANIIGNILLFLPLGIFLPYLFPASSSIKKVAGICFLCSLSIELIQLILRQFGTYRTVDIDDVILNTLGGIIGWLIFSKLLTKYVSNTISHLR